MKTFIVLSGLSIAALLAGPAIAQNDQPGESRAQPSTPHTKQQRQAARSKRQTTGRSVARQGNRNLDVDPGPAPGSVTPATNAERAAAKQQRRREGTEATRNPPQVGPAGTSP
jgi:hypothetical protein